MPAVALPKSTAWSAAAPDGSCSDVHVAPPSMVRNTVPASPTAQPRFASPNRTPRSVAVTPVGAACAVQVCPPLVVFRIVAPAPTAQPTVADPNDTASRSAVTPDGGVRTVQVAPESLEVMIVAFRPTSTQLAPPGWSTAWRPGSGPLGTPATAVQVGVPLPLVPLPRTMRLPSPTAMTCVPSA